MKGIKKGLAILLVLCTLLSMVVMTGAGTADTAQDAPTAQSADNFLRIFSLDCGRIYFSVDQIKGIIRELAANDYTHLQLAFGNGGLRFLLDDMSVTVGETTYASENVKSAIQAGNTYYAEHDGHDGSQAANTCLTQENMDTILNYASSRGIQIIPLLNSPGHFNAVVYAMGLLGITNAGYPVNGENSPSTVNINNDTAKEFATALIRKYITYFKGKGCTYFHMGADEFANDPTDGTNQLGFKDEIKNDFVGYVNNVATMIANAGMTPVMFNDGYAWTSAGFNSNIVVSYWTRGSVSSTEIANEGHKIINTNQAWYYVLGSPFGAAQNNWCSYARATNGVTNTSVTSLVDGGSVGDKLIGAAMCFWCDYTNQTYTEEEQTRVGTLISTLATNNPTYFTVQQEETNVEREIYVTVNGTTTDTINGADYSKSVDTSELDTSYATVSAELEQEAGSKETEEVSSIISGKHYLIVNNRANTLLNVSTTATTNQSTQGLALSGSLSATSDQLWTITTSGSGYTVQNTSGQYLTIGQNTAFVSSDSAILSLNYSGSTWTISQNDYYLNDFGNQKGVAAGWKDRTASTDSGSQWKIYEVVTTAATDSTKVTFNGVAIGTTYVTVGNVHYTIHVVEEDLSTVSLTYHPWISNLAIYPDGTGSDNCTLQEGEARPVTIPATQSGVYSEQGVAFSTLVAPTGDWRWEGTGIETYFWKGTVLPYGSHQCGDDQADNKETDMSMSGTDFTYLRYWGGDWSYSSDRVNWTKVTDTDEVCAYYLQKTAVTTEVDTYVKDWAFTTNNSDKSSSRYQKALSFAVVYPNGQLSPSTEQDIYSQSTLIYWDNLNPMTFIRIGTNGVYEIEKITYTFGERVNNSSGRVNWTSNDSINWEKTGTGTAEEWYDETVCWDENYGTEPVVNGADLQDAINAGNPTTTTNNGEATNYNGTWGANDAVLILIYLKPVVTEDSLIVRYYDDTANAEITNFAIQVANESTAEPKTFRNSLTPAFDGEDANTVYSDGLQENAYVTNLNNINETIEQDLTKLSSLRGKYASGLYQYVGAEISEDGKTLTLHYNLDSSKLSKNYVVDFGLPVEIPFADLVKETNTIQSVTVASPANGTATIGDSAIRYAPERAYAGVVTLSVTVTFKDNTTQVFRVGITPATTVYYEEGFAVPYNASATGGSKGDTPQKTELAGKKTNVYGYDAAYASAVGDSNGTVMKLDAGAGAATFTFTGTGVDIYTSSTTDTGSLMIRVVASNGALVKVLSVNTVMKDGRTDATTGQAVTAAYHVPVVSLSGLAHGTYTLQIAAVKSGSAGAKEVYLDGFRVYGTLDSAGNAYHAEGGVYYKDKEDNPTFIELRDEVLTAQNVSTDGSQYANQIAENVISQVYAASGSTTGAVITSNNANFNKTELQDLLDNGPKNEIYLQPSQALTFTITTNREVQIGLKALNEGTSYSINNRDSVALNASTDMFYTVLNKAENETEQTITITNNGTGILSITKLKVCDDPNATLGELTAEDLIPALVSLGYEAEPVEAEAVLNITVQAGDQTVTAQLTATGIEGESHTFTAAEIKAAAEAALPEGYTLDGVTFEDVTVVCGAQGETSYTAAAVQNPTPDQPTKVLQKLLAVIKNIFERLFRWL